MKLPTKQQLEYIVEEADSVEQLEKLFQDIAVFSFQKGFNEALNEVENYLEKCRFETDSQNKEKAKASPTNDDFIPGF